MKELSEIPPICQYCGSFAELVDSSKFYKKSYGMMWECEPCDARVGCHTGSNTALGVLANKELRLERREAHGAFDPLWKYNGRMVRTEAYAWLAHSLGIKKEDCHIAMFDVETCRKVVQLCLNKMDDYL